MKKRYLLIAKDGSPDDWYEPLNLEVTGVRTKLDDPKFDPPRIEAMLDEEQVAMFSNDHEVVKSVGCNEPLTDKAISDIALGLYKHKDTNPYAEPAADALVDLMARIKKISRVRSSEKTDPKKTEDSWTPEEMERAKPKPINQKPKK